MAPRQVRRLFKSHEHSTLYTFSELYSEEKKSCKKTYCEVGSLIDQHSVCQIEQMCVQVLGTRLLQQKGYKWYGEGEGEPCCLGI